MIAKSRYRERDFKERDSRYKLVGTRFFLKLERCFSVRAYLIANTLGYLLTRHFRERNSAKTERGTSVKFVLSSRVSAVPVVV